MNKHYLTLSFLLISLYGFAQKQSGAQELFTINLNDTSYTRILNGVILNDNYIVKDFARVQYIRNKQDIDKLGINSNKSLMILEIETSDIEYKIDSVLYSRRDFIDNFKFPLNIQLPISINGKLLTYDEKLSKLSQLKLDKIKSINYVNTKTSMDKFNKTPFGVIDLILK